MKNAQAKAKANRRRRVGFLFVAVVLVCFWLSGYHFDERGNVAVACFAASLMALIFGLTCPFFDKKY
jgi:Mg/Co/Ni transporter MgtE